VSAASPQNSSPRARRLARGVVLPILVALGWWALLAFHWADERIVASIGQVIHCAIRWVATGAIWIDAGSSLARNLVGFSTGALAGIAAGIALSFSAFARSLVLPSINALKQVSIFAWVPLISVWFGLGEASRIFFIAFSVFFPVLFNTAEGIAGVPGELLEVARVFRFSRWQAVRRIVWPAALPSVFTGLYVGLVMSWMVTLGAEYMLTATHGVGYLLLDGRENFRMDQVILGVLVVGLIGFGVHAVADAAERRLLRWRGTSPTIEV
jgi:sulfonate transport system permease protein